ncbi:MAG TPA: N-acyl homoserine lactonase family protein [Stellaceae bacterium]|jgi:glyoxylase-like metal-dependent hydrolase (beta-lactamase superfamily II)
MDGYEVYAVRYAHHERRAGENFLGGDPHDAPMPLDYFVWAIFGDGKTYIVDTGFGAEQARLRKRELLRSPTEGLKAIGIDPAAVEDVIITHMHYDHAGGLDLFPNATFHIQDREMAFCSGRAMCHHAFSHSLAVDDVVGMVRRLFAGRVRFHDGDEELAPGLGLHFIGGHTMGLQSVRVMTRRGPVVLASDAAHLYAHLDQGRAYPVVYNVDEMLEGHRTLKRLAASPRHIVPGHDPLVAKYYPAARPGLEGIVMRLDVEPKL